MPPPPQRLAEPTIALILGGTTTVARHLAAYLLEGDKPRVQFVRLVDRFSVNPPTTYLDEGFRDLLAAPGGSLEYIQANLANAARHAELFTPPARRGDKETGWTRFDLVFDLTGEDGFDKPEVIQISNTYQLALALATSATKLAPAARPRAYVRLQQPFYEMKSAPVSAPGHSEKDKLKPDGIRGRWWHETLRGIAKLDALNFGIVRCAAFYGSGAWDVQICPRLVCGHVYSYLSTNFTLNEEHRMDDLLEVCTSSSLPFGPVLAHKEEMKFLHNSDLRVSTVHAVDVAQALYLTAVWLVETPRADALKEAGVKLHFPFSPPTSSPFSLGALKRSSSFSQEWKSIKTVVPEDEEVVAPMFNAVDDGASTQDSIARAVADVWGIKYGFLNTAMAALVQQFSKSDFNDMVEDVNEKHIGAWSEMLAKSNPPIDSTPLTPFLEAHAFRRMAVCLDAGQARRVLGFKPAQPRVAVDELRAMAQGFQKDKLWPTL